MEIQVDTFTIQEIAEVSGLSTHTLRYYERIGLIHRIDRADNTHRRYTHEDVEWIDFLNKLRATGMPIQQMQEYAELHRQGDATLPERVVMLKALRYQVQVHIEELSDNLELIGSKVEWYEHLIAEQISDAT